MSFCCSGSYLGESVDVKVDSFGSEVGTIDVTLGLSSDTGNSRRDEIYLASPNTDSFSSPVSLRSTVSAGRNYADFFLDQVAVKKKCC